MNEDMATDKPENLPAQPLPFSIPKFKISEEGCDHSRLHQVAGRGESISKKVAALTCAICLQ